MIDSSTLKELNKKVCRELWQVVTENEPHRVTETTPRLIVPRFKDGDIRISEQEARFVYASFVFRSTDYYYSVETPTQGLYGEGRRALSDMSLYKFDSDAFSKLVNIEFKAHNPPEEHIDKDIKKLLGEQVPGNWFHLLRNADSATIRELMGKFRAVFRENPNTDSYIVFCFCVYEKRWAMVKTLRPNDNPQAFFSLGYSVKGGEIQVNGRNGWTIIK